jgi:hypothetical protein
LEDPPTLRTDFVKGNKMKKNNWLIVGVIAVIAFLLLFGGGMMSGWGYGGYGYRNWGMMGPGMMGRWGYSPFGWIGMAFMWLIPVGILALIILGVTALVQNPGNPTLPSSLSPCSNCGKGVQADWQNCPHCGTVLK